MIKKIFLLTLLGLFLGFGFSGARYREQLPDHNIYTFVHYQKAQDEIADQCTAQSITNAIARRKAITSYVQTILEKENQVKQRYKSKELIKNMQKIIATIPNTNRDKRCEVQRLLIEIMKQLRQNHMDIIYEHNMQHDFENIEDSGKIEGVNFKKTLLQQKYIEYKKYEDLLKLNDIKIEGYTNLYGDEQLLATHLTKLTRALMYYTIYELNRAGVRTREDIQQLIPKTKIEYHPGVCEDYHGKVKVNYLLWSDGSITDTNVQEIVIKINGCYKLFTLENIELLLKKIMAHELGGHIIHYLKDENFEDFWSMCRSDIHTRNNNCDDDDFITPYAQTNAYEDFAETFTYRWLDLENPSNEIIQKKYQHMENFVNSRQ